MYEEPPPLPFPSLQNLKVVAADILKNQRNPTTPDVEFRFFEPEPSNLQTEKKKARPTNKACEVCKKKKVRCDVNSFPNEHCTRTNCQCLHHEDVSKEDQVDAPVSPSSSSVATANTSTPQSSESIPSTTVFRKPGLLKSGHYTGETSFCGYLPSLEQPSVILAEESFPTFTPFPKEPFIDASDKLYLIDVYYENMNPFYPLMAKQEMLFQLNHPKNSYLSPLFFYALFARAAHVETAGKLTVDNRTFQSLGAECMNYASTLVNYYKDKPRVSTVLALVILTNHLEQEKKHQDLTKAWLWAGEAFRMALDLGIHRSIISTESDSTGQLCIRTFWLAYIADCTISMTYGRPSATEEKVLDVTLPIKIPTDDNATAQWIDGLNSLIALSKVTARVIKFNYCPPPPFIIQGPVKRHNAFLVSVDSWLIDIMHPMKEPESPISNSPNVVVEEPTISKRIAFQKQMFLCTNLILLHRPYVNDVLAVRNTSNRPSYDICSYAAVIITDTARRLDSTELLYHSKSPMIAYALVMALRVHIMNAASANPDKYNANKNFSISLATLSKLPQSQDTSSMLHHALIDLEQQYNNRFSLSQEREDDNRVQQQLNQPVVTAAQIVFSPGTTEKRKERSNGNPERSVPAQPTDLHSAMRNSIVIKDYNHHIDATSKKKKKAKIQQPSVDNQQQKLKLKQKQKQQNLQRVFPSFNVVVDQKQQTQQQQDQFKIKFDKDQPIQYTQQIPQPPPPAPALAPAPQQQQQHQLPLSHQQFQFDNAISQQNLGYYMQYISNNNNTMVANPVKDTNSSITFNSLDFPMLQHQEPHYYNSTATAANTAEPQQQQHSFLDTTTANTDLDKFLSSQMDFDSILFDGLFNQRQNCVPDEAVSLYCVAAQDDTMGVLITRANEPSTTITTSASFNDSSNFTF
ncbi:hypothetical protein [Parasitella parasitica]|uniref:Zn(2)-C6 fungal-type domain-containing protein n=1 Tax=Parasitella parasitica TaxID=35722 RepID=A0A0B7N1A3_9FUNG|nr:hypothetical protein [Parasitella parasitica]